MVRNMVISVEEGIENWRGTMTGFPTVESSMVGMLIVGAFTVETSVAALTVTVTGRIFLK